MKNLTISNIVLVDENLKECQNFRMAVEEIGRNFNLLCFHSCEDVMEHLNNAKIELPCIVFLEIHFPEMGGIDCLKEIRTHKTLKDLSVAIYSNSATEDNQELAFENGANIFIKKPGNREDLKNIITSVVDLSFQFGEGRFNRDTFLFSI